MLDLFYQPVVLTLTVGFSIFLIGFLWGQPFYEFVREKVSVQRAHLQERLSQMFIEISESRLTVTISLLSFGLGFAVFLAAWPNFVVGVIAGVAIGLGGWILPRFVVDFLYAKRCSVVVDQMVDAVTIMANGIRSGLSVPQTMERVTENMKGPITQEFSLVLSQVRLGLSVEEALNQMADRVKVPDLQMLVTAINILKETGGNLAETFQTISETIRERQKIHKKIEALTAQGIMQGIIITLVPFFLLIVFLVVDPGYIQPLFNTTLGIILIFVMLSLQIAGGLMIRKIVRIKI